MIESKLNGESLDIINDNISKLKELFPEVVSENEVDFEKFKEIFGYFIDDSNERYSFLWKNKSEVIKQSQKPSNGTLIPCKDESKNWDSTQNLYIEGDNLEVLKLLQKSYYNKVKLIYIDPPYNTGNDFIYEDDYKDNLQNYITKDANGFNLSSNIESDGRFHSNWLNMMYPRLKLSRNLLKDNGVIFISINDNEVENLKKICNEIFGEENFVAQFPWQSRQSVQNDTDISNNHEYVLVFAKNRRQTNRRLKSTNAKEWFNLGTFVCLPLHLDKKNFNNPDNDSRGLWKADPFDAPKIRPNLTYIIKNPNTGEEFLPASGRHWRTEEKKYLKLLEDNRIIFGKNGKGKPQLKVFYEEKKMFGSIDNSWWDGNKCGTSTEGTKELKHLFGGVSPFDTPKPVKLINKIINLVSLPNSEDIILDFFSGSCTTAQAVIQKNLDDGGNRKFIMIQIPEICKEGTNALKLGFNNICEIGEERIRRAGDKIVDESGNKDLDIGFKVFKLDSSNLTKWNPDYDNLEESLISNADNIIPNRTELDLVYEIMLKYGIDLSVPVEEKEVNDKKIYSVGFGALLICLDNNVTSELAEDIIKVKDDLGSEVVCVFFKDNGFKSDSDKTNIKETLRANNVDEFITI